MQKIKNKKTEISVLVLIIIAACVLRFYNLNWDSGFTFHPDERNIDAAVSRIDLFEQLDPGFFAYGGLTIYLYKVTGEIINYVTGQQSWTFDWGKINIIGRFYSAYFSTITIIAIYTLSKKLFDKRIALLAAALSAFFPSFIQTAHFGITENLLTLMVVLITIACLNILEKPKIASYALVGALLGLSLSAKTAAISFLIIPTVTVLIRLLPIKLKSKTYRKEILSVLVIGLITVTIFTLFSPYTFLNYEKFMESMKYEGGVVSGELLVPYVLQFIGTTNYLFQIKNLFWQIGFVNIVAIPSVFFVIYKMVKERNKEYLVLLSFPVAYFLYVGSWHTKFIRYMLPILPFLAIFSSYTLWQIKRKYANLGTALITFFVVVTAVWGLSFFAIYLKPQSRIAASEWVYTNIPKGSVIKGEHWDDGIPINLKSGKNIPEYKYDINQLELYNDDDQRKIEHIATYLEESDYVILASRRLYGTLMRLDERYPITSKYYKLLFDGRLGYEKVNEFSSYPSFLGYDIVDDASEETFQVYDHPKIIIFENSKRYSKEDIESILTF